jgi:hypothetical protein
MFLAMARPRRKFLLLNIRDASQKPGGSFSCASAAAAITSGTAAANFFSTSGLIDDIDQALTASRLWTTPSFLTVITDIPPVWLLLLPCSGDLHAGPSHGLRRDWWQVTRPHVRIVGAGIGKQSRCDDYCRNQISKRHANPHQGARILLVL